ncbi:MAG TPA: hypothetical protein VID47_14520 [Actinomycetota bacterium]|jgi:hypothetical protein
MSWRSPFPFDLDGCLAKVQLAHSELQAYQTDHLVVFKTDPIRLRTEPEREPYRYLFTAEYVPRLPTRLGARLGSVVHELRSALDHLAWQIARNDGVMSPGPELRFPLSASPDAFRADHPWLPRLEPEHRAMLEEDQPYRGAGELAELERLAGIERHEVLAPRVSATLVLTPQLVIRDASLDVSELEWLSRPGPMHVGATLCRFTVSRPFSDGAGIAVRGITVPGSTLDGDTDVVARLNAVGARVVQTLWRWDARLAGRPQSEWPEFDGTPSVFPPGAVPFMAS